MATLDPAPSHSFLSQVINGHPSSVCQEEEVFVLHRTKNLWWLYRKVQGQYVKVKTSKVPAMKPGELVNALVNDLGYRKFRVEVIES